MALELRNPHSILAAFETRPRDVLEIRVQAQKPPGAWDEVVRLAESHRVRVLRGVKRRDEGRRAPKSAAARTERTGAGEATLREHGGVALESLFADDRADAGGPGLWLALDQLQDPHNVGAVFRSAAFFGVRGIVTTRDRSAPLNATVYDVASGGLEYVPFSTQPNLSRALDAAKQAGLWILGSSEHATDDIRQIDRDRPWLLVLGNEERGLRRLTLEKCDQVCRLTPRGAVNSLNVSVAAGVLIASLTS